MESACNTYVAIDTVTWFTVHILELTQGTQMIKVVGDSISYKMSSFRKDLLNSSQNGATTRDDQSIANTIVWKHLAEIWAKLAWKSCPYASEDFFRVSATSPKHHSLYQSPIVLLGCFPFPRPVSATIVCHASSDPSSLLTLWNGK